jgi:hypothetical protein
MRGQAERLPMRSRAALIKSTRDLGGANGQGALFAVNPTTRQRTVLSDFGNAAQGPTGLAPEGVVVCNGLAGLGTTIYVVDNAAGTNNFGAIFTVDPATGNRTLLSDFGNGAQGPGGDPFSIAILPTSLPASM